MDATTPITATFLTQYELAELLRLPERTLEDWRSTHSGPPYLELDRHARYDVQDVLARVQENRHGKPHFPAAELGTIDVKRLASGRYRARASPRDDDGAFRRLTATDETEELAVLRSNVRQ